MKKLILLILTLFIYSCSSGGGDSTASTLKVNLLGTWNYDVFTKNSVCDGLIAKGITTVQSQNGDVTKIGNITIQGEGLDVDSFSNCIFTNLDEVQTDWQGRPAEQTANDYLNFTNQDNTGDNTIKSVRIDSFTASKIVEVTEFTNSVVITSVLTR